MQAPHVPQHPGGPGKQPVGPHHARPQQDQHSQAAPHPLRPPLAPQAEGGQRRDGPPRQRYSDYSHRPHEEGLVHQRLQYQKILFGGTNLAHLHKST